MMATDISAAVNTYRYRVEEEKSTLFFCVAFCCHLTLTSVVKAHMGRQTCHKLISSCYQNTSQLPRTRRTDKRKAEKGDIGVYKRNARFSRTCCRPLSTVEYRSRPIWHMDSTYLCMRGCLCTNVKFLIIPLQME